MFCSGINCADLQCTLTGQPWHLVSLPPSLPPSSYQSPPHHHLRQNCRCALQVVESGDQLKKRTTVVSTSILCSAHSRSCSTVSESQHVVCHWEIKENWTAKQKKKALKAAYQGHPDVFEKEPSVLLSDIDRQEDTMVQAFVFFPNLKSAANNFLFSSLITVLIQGYPTLMAWHSAQGKSLRGCTTHSCLQLKVCLYII